MKQIIFSVIFSALACCVQATTYYVNDASTVGDVLGLGMGTGAVGNNGTAPATPKRLISQVVASYTLVAGDIIYVETGAYTDQVTLNNINGTAGNGINIIGAGVTNTIITLPNIANQHGFRLNNCSYITIYDLTITNVGGVNTSDGIKVYDNSDYNEIYNVAMYNVEYGIDIMTYNFTNTAGTSTTSIPENNSIHNCYIEATWVGVRIKAPSQNEVGVSQCNYLSTPCSIYGPVNNSVYENTIIDIGPTSYACIELQAVGGRNDFFRNKLIVNAGVTTTGGGIVLANNVNGSVLTNNYIINLSSTGGQGVYVVPAPTRTYQLDFIHNSIYTIESCIDGSTGLKDFTMVNNILYSTNGFCIDFGALADPKAATALMKECRNNLYYFPGYASSTTTAGLARYNNTTVVGTVAAWQTYNIDNVNSDAYSIGGSNAASDPQFINPAGYILDIPNSSPAVDNTYVLGNGDAGIGTNSQVASSNFTPVVKDIYETARPVGIRKDIGAFENLTPMPINLLEFKSRCADDGVKLNWSTLLENGNMYFTIEGSVDGIYYTDIANIPGSINSSGLRQYDYLVSGFKYSCFRLRQTDVDGSVSRSYPILSDCYKEIEMVIWQHDQSLYVQVPAGLRGETCVVMIYNVNGQLLLEKKIVYTGSAELHVVPLDILVEGVYPSKVICGDKMKTIKLLR